jgi:hypothetical protein
MFAFEIATTFFQPLRLASSKANDATLTDLARVISLIAIDTSSESLCSNPE